MKYDEYAESLGFLKHKNVYVMEMEGFQIYLKDWQYLVLSIPSFYIPVDRPIDKEMIKELQIRAFNNACSIQSLGNPNDTLIVTLPEGNKAKEKTQELMKDILKEVIGYLKEKGYNAMKLCPICHKEGEYNVFGDNYCPMHLECRNLYLEKLTEKAKEEKGFNKKYVFAILLSILGIGIGLITPILLTIYLHDFFTGVIGLVPIFATLGLWLSHAPSKKWLKITVGSLVFISVVTFLVIALPYLAKFSEDSTLTTYFFSNGWAGFRKALFGGILAFGGFGGAKFLDKFKKDYNKELKTFKEKE